jgi:hypothetical protein
VKTLWVRQGAATAALRESVEKIVEGFNRRLKTLAEHVKALENAANK